jgi:MerR family copper efflux transcriptional regulator
MTKSAGDQAIGVVAAELGVTVDALRYYERAGLSAPSRDGGGRRRYPESEVDRLRIILALRRVGVSIEEIKAVLSGKVSSRDARTNVEDVRSRLAALAGTLEQRQRELDAARGLVADWVSQLDDWLASSR